MTPKQINYERTAQTIIRNLERRQMKGYYYATAKEAVQGILDMIPQGASIGWGGSMTLQETGLMDAVRGGQYTIFDRDAKMDDDTRRKVYADILNCDFFLMSTNAITMDGELVNIDGRGSRVAFLCFGPSNVLVVAGMNKVVSDVDSGIKRVRDIAAPPNATRLDRKTPCTATGKCGDCTAPGCICSQTVVTRFSTIPDRIKVILVGEELGY
ncbi:MAG: lactate utilization protein [Lachnospiraceae bacterium]